MLPLFESSNPGGASTSGVDGVLIWEVLPRAAASDGGLLQQCCPGVGSPQVATTKEVAAAANMLVLFECFDRTNFFRLNVLNFTCGHCCQQLQCGLLQWRHNSMACGL